MGGLACFACYFGINTCQTMQKLIKPINKHGLFFVFLRKAAPKCKCFSLAQCFLWWWGKPAENRSIVP